MSDSLLFASDTSTEKFREAIKPLLPNENPIFAISLHERFLVLTNRRLVILKETNALQYWIEHVIPYDCFARITLEKNTTVQIVGNLVDQNGLLTAGKFHKVRFRIPKVNKGKGRNGLQDAISHVPSLIKSISTTEESQAIMPPIRDYKYLLDLPCGLTHNAILDINTILQDKPIADALFHEAKKYLGENPFIVEDSLRSGEDQENGILFAAGKSGYIWIQGKKYGRYMQNVLVDKVDWTNINCLVFDWTANDGRVEMSYSLQKGRSERRAAYAWKPPIPQEISNNQWFYQPLNFPWIFADLMSKYSGTPLPAVLHSETQRGKIGKGECRYYD